MTMINTEPFGLSNSATENTPLHLMTVEQYSKWKKSANVKYKNWINATNFAANPGETIYFSNNDGCIDFGIVVVGANPIWDGSKACEKLPKLNWKPIFSNNKNLLKDFVLGWGLAQYDFNKYRKNQKTKSNFLLLPNSIDISDVVSQLSGTYLCRDLINHPPNFMNPDGLEEAAKTLCKNHKAEITVYKKGSLKNEFPAINTVGRAAEFGPRLVEILWGKKGPKVTLIGKGITFDTGGLDLKPSKGMELMKKDMGGAALTLGLADALMTSKIKIQLRVLLPIAENAVSKKSMRPLDVIETRSGLEVEVGNTDAEGRLVIADAITYAIEKKPDFFIDFATLTGAARVALGTELPALFCNSEDTAKGILKASESQNDPLWRLPLFDDYDRHLDSGYAALSSTGVSAFGGAITAALFLRRFAGKKSNWAHIDLMAWNLNSRPGRPKGGEAMGLRALFSYISSLAKR